MYHRAPLTNGSPGAAASISSHSSFSNNISEVIKGTGNQGVRPLDYLMTDKSSDKMKIKDVYTAPESTLTEISPLSFIATSFSDGGEGLDTANDFKYSNGWL